jgi:hypothetical protein
VFEVSFISRLSRFLPSEGIGIELVSERFCHARILARKLLTKRELRKVDFCFGEIDDLKRSDVCDVTVAYYGLEPHENNTKMFRQLFGRQKVQIQMYQP